ncbi:MAG: hypothetical protein AMXMBFR64_07820 [Myxococcales bacterium]
MMIALRGALTGATLLVALAAQAQPDAARLQHELDKLGTVGTVLYIAAHPDDENTRLLSYLANERKVRTVYLSLTRGDGGQNLIGEEQDSLFGLIRTQELMAARRLDGAEQLFTRAVDFGYSKTAEETLALWGHEEVLADVVWAVRLVQPDAIIVRFATGGSPNHGHHTASAILGAEAFTAAADPARFPEQLSQVAPWQADRLLYNVSHWTITPETDKSRWLSVDVGGYSPLLGTSWGELAGRSRSMHKSQGFGAAQQRGAIIEYFEPLAGTRPTGDILEGLDLTWGRLAGGAAVGKAVEDARAAFDPRAPHRAVPALLAARAAATLLPDGPWKERTLARLDSLIAHLSGLYLAALADRVEGVPGAPLTVRIEATNRSPVELRLLSAMLPDGRVVEVDRPLPDNLPMTLVEETVVPPGAPYTAPYWLREPPDGALFRVPPALLGLPVGPPALPVVFAVRAGDQTLHFTRDLAYSWVDPVEGERTRALEVAPPATVAFDREALVVPSGAPRLVRLLVRASVPGLRATVRLELPAGFSVEPRSHAVSLDAVGDEAAVTFTLRGEGSGRARAVVDAGDGPVSVSVARIDYPHIPIQTIHREASVPLVSVPLARVTDRVGYVPGPGDKVADALRDAGYAVDELTDAQLTAGDLSQWRSIVVGVRAFSSTPRIKVWAPRLHEWASRGGTLVVQYATRNHLSDLLAPIGPKPISVGRGRVTDEGAAVTFLGDHPILTRPNAITAADFDGWVQERGLYFADSWDPAWTPVLSMADPGEDPQLGSLLVMPHGKGRIVYTGLSFFRQLPAGVPGAFRLMANLIDHAN